MGRRTINETPKEVTQSYIVTSARYDFSVYEKRILYRIVELIQAELKGQPIGQGITIEPDLFNHKWITMPVSMFLRSESEDEHYTRVKNAFRKLEARKIEDTSEGLEIFSIIEMPKIVDRSGMVKFLIHSTIYSALLDFSRGYTQYELQVAFNFRSQYTMRFYELISKNKMPSITYSLDKLRQMFMLENRYALTKDFIKKVIDPPQKELEKSKAPYWFTYEPVKTGRAFTHIKFRVHYRPEFDDSVKKKTSLRWDVSREFLDILNRALDTDSHTWKPHRELLAKAEKIEFHEIQKILRKASEARNPVGYVIGAFRRQVQAKGTGQELP